MEEEKESMQRLNQLFLEIQMYFTVFIRFKTNHRKLTNVSWLTFHFFASSDELCNVKRSLKVIPIIFRAAFSKAALIISQMFL